MVGGRKLIRSRFRVVASVSRPIAELVSEGVMRPDLSFRLEHISVELPPLRKRGEDIELLVRHFLNASCNGSGPVRLSQDAVELLRKHDWLGNVRELENVVQRVVAFGQSAREITAGLVRRALAVSKRQPAAEDLARVLEAHDWNMSSAARAMGLDRSTLRSRVKRLGLVRPSETA